MRKNTYKFVVKRGGKIIHRDITTGFAKLAAAWKAQYHDCKVVQIGRITTWEAALRWKYHNEVR